MKAEYVPQNELEKLFKLMQPDNAAVLKISVDTGLRIGDVLKMEHTDLRGNILTFVASKTGKRSTIAAPASVLEIFKARSNNGSVYVFPGRDRRKHRTRQAVYTDLRKASLAASIPEHVSPHSARKTFAVQLRKKGFSQRSIQNALQHSSAETTKIYSQSDRLDLTPERLQELIDHITGKVIQEIIKRLRQ